MSSLPNIRRHAVVDVDEVLIDYIPAFLALFNRKYGLSISVEDITDYSLENILGVRPEDIKGLVHELSLNHGLLKLKPAKGAKEGLKRLARSCDVDIATARPNYCKVDTVHSLRLKFPLCFSHVYFAKGYDNNINCQTKAEICKELGAILIDDSFKFAYESAELNGVAILVDKPWNQGRTHNRVIRVANMEEAASVIESIQIY